MSFDVIIVRGFCLAVAGLGAYLALCSGEYVMMMVFAFFFATMCYFIGEDSVDDS